ncbi:PP2C family protein-serine/threonine phosphatase [Patulibacter sp.]|uniref:PP2C family protein-serine/threonine phosphatase n=1 Tax=Patulibacter sp. TaxID=1912859 RepID=UPI00271B27C5|nr:SpoIIE family protein phosphatase [Patulibacter sp.]MDO9406799.1 SpoIIE family protein phosphatase [Patulibacter sp.]
MTQDQPQEPAAAGPRDHDDVAPPARADTTPARKRRSDAALNYTRLVAAAMRVLREQPDASMERIAQVAEVGRATAYRHFPRRSDLVAAAAQQSRDDAESNERDVLRPAGELASTTPAVLDVADVLNKVPPHLLGEQIVAEAQRLAGVSAVALYAVDIDGSRLLRLHGPADFPAELPVSLGVGPELPRSAIASLRHVVGEQMPGAAVVPMYLRGRATGALIAVGAREETLQDLARQGAAALGLGGAYTDVYAMAARRQRISPASEVQQNLLPPRVARIGGAGLAGNVLPSYDVGGDWFDYAENPDGAWIGLADCTGVGPRAAGLAAVLLGAFRAGRRNERGLAETVDLMDRTLTDLDLPAATATAIVGRWHAPASTFTWINRAHPAPILISADGRVEELDGAVGEILGVAGGSGAAAEPGGAPANVRRLEPEDRLIIYSDGICDRVCTDGTPFGYEGIVAAARTAPNPTAANTVNAIEEAVLGASGEALTDDATLIVLSPTGVDALRASD